MLQRFLQVSEAILLISETKYCVCSPSRRWKIKERNTKLVPQV